jgi:hypothetical protein
MELSLPYKEQKQSLATDLCGIDAIKNKTRKSLSALGDNTVACTPGGGCC